jgi:hypothetical protein
MPTGTYQVLGWSPAPVGSPTPGTLDINFSRLDTAQDALKGFFSNAAWKSGDMLALDHFSDVSAVDKGLTAIGSTTETVDDLNQKTEQLAPDRYTAICSGIREAAMQLGAGDNTNRFIVLLTDGVANVACNGADETPLQKCPTQGASQGPVADAQCWADYARSQYKATVYVIGFGRDVSSTDLGHLACDRDFTTACSSDPVLKDYEGQYFFAGDKDALAHIYHIIATDIANQVNSAEVEVDTTGMHIRNGSVMCLPGECDDSSPFEFVCRCANGACQNGQCDQNILVFHQAKIAKQAPEWWKGTFDFDINCQSAFCDTNSVIFPPPTQVKVTVGGEHESFDYNALLPIDYRFSDLNVEFHGAHIDAGHLVLDLVIANNGFTDMNSVTNTLFGDSTRLETVIWNESANPAVPMQILGANIPEPYYADAPFDASEPDLNFYQLVYSDGVQPPHLPTPYPGQFPTCDPSAPGDCPNGLIDTNMVIGRQNDPGAGVDSNAGLCQKRFGSSPWNCKDESPDNNFLLSGVTVNRTEKVRVEINPNGAIAECASHNNLILACNKLPSDYYYWLEYWVWRG